MPSFAELCNIVLAELRTIDPWPHRNDTRMHCKGDPSDVYPCFALGQVRKQDVHDHLVESRYNAKYAALYDACKALIAAHDPAFRWTTIQVNGVYQVAPHTDGRNAGLSYVIALGDFTGGEFFAEQSGVFDVHNKFALVDGHELHMCAPFEGERYSLVFFNMTPARPST